MTSAHLFNVNETMRHAAIRVFNAMGVSTLSGSAEPAMGGSRSVPISVPMPVGGQPWLDSLVPGAGMALPPFYNADNTSSGAGMAAADWDLLFSALAWRLWRAVGDRPASAPASKASDTTGEIQATVLECIADMKLLQAALATECNQGAPRTDGFEKTALTGTA